LGAGHLSLVASLLNVRSMVASSMLFLHCAATDFRYLPISFFGMLIQKAVIEVSMSKYLVPAVVQCKNNGVLEYVGACYCICKPPYAGYDCGEARLQVGKRE
jgi:hypothetical protein